MATECTLFQKKKNRNPKPKIKGEASEMLRVERGFKKLPLSSAFSQIYLRGGLLGLS